MQRAPELALFSPPCFLAWGLPRAKAELMHLRVPVWPSTGRVWWTSSTWKHVKILSSAEAHGPGGSEALACAWAGHSGSFPKWAGSSHMQGQQSQAGGAVPSNVGERCVARPVLEVEELQV